MNDYREAWAIELYDPMVLIRGEYESAGTSDYGEQSGFVLRGKKGFKSFASEFGLSFFNLDFGFGTDDNEIQITRQMRMWIRFASETITRIEAQEIDNTLSIRIYVHHAANTNVPDDKDEDEIVELSYSGRYLVHWAPVTKDQ